MHAICIIVVIPGIVYANFGYAIATAHIAALRV
jgi:hypothetical protein